MRNGRKISVWKIIKRIIVIMIVLYAAAVLLQVVFSPEFTPENFVADTINVITESGSDDAAVDTDEIICEIRDAMIDRESEIKINFRKKDGNYINDDEAFLNDFIEPAMSEVYATGCYSGDYLENVLKSCSYRIVKTGSFYTATISVIYRDTLAQEAELDAAVRQAVADLGLAGMNEQDRVRTIYQYIINNVDFDTASTDEGGEDISMGGPHTAYSAMINGRAVCQGYAGLFYVMCKNAGIDARIISGKATSGKETGEHAWNMVCIDGAWYYLDVTWDDVRPNNWKYYLLSSEEIVKDHFQED